MRWTVALAFAAAGAAQAEAYIIRTHALDCDWCAYDVQQAFEAMPGVESFEVDVDGAFLVRTRSGVRLEPRAVRRLLERKGFAFLGIEVQR